VSRRRTESDEQAQRGKRTESKDEKEREPLLGRLRSALEALDCAGRTVLVAASGGIDSSVLAHGVRALAAELRIALVLGHVHHGLRGAEADADEAFVRSLGVALGVPTHVRRVAPRRLREGGPSRSRPTLRLLRGIGPAGLGGIPERSPDGRIVRPLLALSRAEIERFARARGLVWREDASNRDPAYARARLRRDWLRGLGEAFNPRWLRAIGDLAEAQRRESEWIEPLVTHEAETRLARDGEGWTLACAGWHALPVALARRLARRALHEAGAGRDVTRVHLERMLIFLASARTGAKLELPGGLVLERERGRVRLRGGRAQRGC